MTTVTDATFLLGNAFALLTMARNHMIQMDDRIGLALIEDQYQKLEMAIEVIYYQSTEKKDGSGK